jgi:hypothetical protein
MDLAPLENQPQGLCEDFEKQLAYFFGVSDETPVSAAYIAALHQLESVDYGNVAPQIERKVLDLFEVAYRSIAQQQKWHFDIEEAARLEFEIIVGMERGLAVEEIQALSIDLYKVVFQSDSPEIRKAVMLRTFLYQYKTQIQKSGMKISLADERVMLNLAATSEEYLNLAPKKSAVLN